MVFERPSLPITKAQGSSVIWPGMKTPSVIAAKSTSEPLKRHFDRT